MLDLFCLIEKYLGLCQCLHLIACIIIVYDLASTFYIALKRSTSSTQRYFKEGTNECGTKECETKELGIRFAKLH